MTAKKKTLTRLGEDFDETLHRMLKEGGEVETGENGRPITDKEGNVVRKRLPSSLLSVIRGRLKDCGISATTPSDEENGVGGIIKQLKLTGGAMKKGRTAMPPLSDDRDAAAG